MPHTDSTDRAPEESPVSSRRRRDVLAPIVHDDRMRKLHETAALVARSELNVLLLGETGVGKEVLAESIHRLSHRARGPLVSLNCGALSESLLESELFGHEAGAFTGAMRAKQGLFELADKGTIFLDEVGELPPSIQVKLLRVLEERKMMRVGGVVKKAIDVRFISATNRGLDMEVQRGAFRQDLFFRLNGISLSIPPLRNRSAEVEPLAQLFIKRAAEQMKLRAMPVLSREAREALRLHTWPGNIRELRNVMERAVVLSEGGAILEEHLRLDREAGQGSVARTMPPPPSSYAKMMPPRPDMEVPQPMATITPLRTRAGEEERRRILEALDRCGGNQTQAAEMLGISRRTLVSRLDLYGLPRPRKRE